MNEKLTTIIENLQTLTLVETVELVKHLEKIFDVDTSLALSVPQIVSTNSLPVPPIGVDIAEEKSSFDIILTEVPPDKKIAILKVVRNVTGLGLKESKDIVDNLPRVVKEGITKQDLDSIKKELEGAGAKFQVK